MDIPEAPDGRLGRLGGWRNGLPKLGGITPMPPPPDLTRKGVPPRPIPREFQEFDIDDREPVPLPMPLATEDMPPGNDEKIDEARETLIVDAGRARNESEEPPPMRPGMKPSVMPP
jgi:hypothetical protein